MEIIVYKGTSFSVFLLVKLYLILQSYRCRATTFPCHFRNMEVESNDGSHLESLDALGPGRRILKKNVHSLPGCQTVTKYCVIFFPNFNKYFVEFVQ